MHCSDATTRVYAGKPGLSNMCRGNNGIICVDRLQFRRIVANTRRERFERFCFERNGHPAFGCAWRDQFGVQVASACVFTSRF